MRERVVFSQRLAGFLMQNGFRLLRLEPNRKKPSLNVFIFEESEGLNLKIESYTKKTHDKVG